MPFRSCQLLLDDFRNNPTGSLVTIRCAPWVYRDKVCLVGDAAHAVVPFYGQGMNAAFEDCVVLDECLDEFRENRDHAFSEYFRRRKENADALADLAIGNFIEMRDKTASKTFRAKKKLDHALEAALPEYICRFTRWSLSQECLTQKRRSGRTSRTHWCIRACS
jgi:kynurenine 3-monooxygenase